MEVVTYGMEPRESLLAPKNIPLPDNRQFKPRNNENNDQAAPRIPVNGQLARLGGPEEGAILDAWSM